MLKYISLFSVVNIQLNFKYLVNTILLN
jgi:hypothetical protein